MTDTSRFTPGKFEKIAVRQPGFVDPTYVGVPKFCFAVAESFGVVLDCFVEYNRTDVIDGKQYPVNRMAPWLDQPLFQNFNIISNGLDLVVSYATNSVFMIASTLTNFVITYGTLSSTTVPFNSTQVNLAVGYNFDENMVRAIEGSGNDFFYTAVANPVSAGYVPLLYFPLKEPLGNLYSPAVFNFPGILVGVFDYQIRLGSANAEIVHVVSLSINSQTEFHIFNRTSSTPFVSGYGVIPSQQLNGAFPAQNISFGSVLMHPKRDIACVDMGWRNFSLLYAVWCFDLAHTQTTGDFLNNSQFLTIANAGSGEEEVVSAELFWNDADELCTIWRLDSNSTSLLCNKIGFLINGTVAVLQKSTPSTAQARSDSALMVHASKNNRTCMVTLPAPSQLEVNCISTNPNELSLTAIAGLSIDVNIKRISATFSEDGSRYNLMPCLPRVIVASADYSMVDCASWRSRPRRQH